MQASSTLLPSLHHALLGRERADGLKGFALLAMLAVWLLATSAPAGAEVLVLRSGEQVQTKGPYEVRGGRVIYTSPSGDLLSLRASEVDLEATETLKESARATGGESTAKPEPQNPSDDLGRQASPRKVVATITNRDVGTARPSRQPVADAAPDNASGEGSSASVQASPSGHLLVVSESSDQLGTQGFVLTGTVANQGNATAVQIRVNATLVDVDGNALEAGTVALDGVRLEPGDSAPFTISLDSAPAYDSVRFDIASVPLVRRPADVPADGDPDATADGDEEGSSSSFPPQDAR